jgi:DNA helicase HerA-like ATPase
LYEKTAVVNLSRFGGEADRALVMALLLVGLCEYRMDCYSGDQAYQHEARNGRLFHLAVVEEAHTVLRRPDPSYAGSGNSQAVVARMFSDMLAEVRQYGQGLLVIDQDPSQLIAGTIKNTSFRIAHKLPHQEDRAALAASMMLRGDQADFLAVLPPGQAVILTDLDDAACWIRMEP